MQLPTDDPILQRILMGGLGMPGMRQGIPGMQGGQEIDPDIRRQMLMATAGNLLAGSGYSPVPQTFGSIAGQALLAGQQAKATGQQDQLRKLLLQKQIERQESPFGNVNPGDYTPESLREFQKTKDYGVLKPNAPSGTKFGAFNPGDYTPASFAKFQKSNNPNDLERYVTPPNPIIQMLGGGFSQVNPSRTGAKPVITPITTPEQERTAAAARAQAEAEAKTTGTNTAENAQLAITNKKAFDAYQASMGGLTTALQGTSTGPIAGRMPAVTSGQQSAEKAIAAMAPTLKSLFRTSGEGTFTDRDQALLLEMIPSRTDRPEARDFAVKNIDAIVRAKLGQGTFDDYYNSLPSGAQFTGPDGIKRVKP